MWFLGIAIGQSELAYLNQCNRETLPVRTAKRYRGRSIDRMTPGSENKKKK